MDHGQEGQQPQHPLRGDPGGGVDQITRRSYRYFKRTIRNVVVYKEAIEELLGEVKRRGFASLLLIGRSDLAFVVEYACAKHGVEYLESDPPADDGVYYLYSEDYIPDDELEGGKPRVSPGVLVG